MNCTGSVTWYKRRQKASTVVGTAGSIHQTTRRVNRATGKQQNEQKSRKPEISREAALVKLALDFEEMRDPVKLIKKKKCNDFLRIWFWRYRHGILHYCYFEMWDFSLLFWIPLPWFVCPSFVIISSLPFFKLLSTWWKRACLFTHRGSNKKADKHNLCIIYSSTLRGLSEKKPEMHFWCRCP